jgi:hypothetical protein
MDLLQRFNSAVPFLSSKLNPQVHWLFCIRKKTQMETRFLIQKWRENIKELLRDHEAIHPLDISI